MLGLVCVVSRKRFSSWYVGLTSALFFAFTPMVEAKDIDLKVGVIQRFGTEPQAQLKIIGSANTPITLKFVDELGNPQNLQAQSLTLEMVQETLANPVLEERLVLSDHATFETAEDSAHQWASLGIRVEVTQPERWQVWAERDVYQTPLLRRWLLASLQEKGYQPYLVTALVNQRLVPSFVLNGKRYTVNELEINSSQNVLQVTDQQKKTRTYGGSLKLQPNSYGSYTLVNQVPLETYLRGVVPHEIGPAAPETATKAQTIIARTYALRNVRRFEADNYQLCADTHCQVYYGLGDTTPKADQAIAATAGLVLTYQNELVDALYSSTTGGVTAPFSDVWNGSERPYLRAIIDSPNPIWDLTTQSLADETTFRRFIGLTQGFNETGRSVFRWNRQSNLQALNEDLKKYLNRKKHPLADFKTIKWLEVTKRSPSGRVLTLTVTTDQGIIELHKNEARSAFGPPRSTLFYVEPIYDNQKRLQAFAFIGGGFGHGVGLSQFGSYNLAKLGWTAQQILEFYYPGTQIQPLNDSIVFWRDPLKEPR